MSDKRYIKGEHVFNHIYSINIVNALELSGPLLARIAPPVGTKVSFLLGLQLVAKSFGLEVLLENCGYKL